METKELQEKIAEYYIKLPENLQKIFAGMEWMEDLKKISLGHGLTDEQNQTLGAETLLLLLGMIHPVEFEETLWDELNAPESIISEIIDEVNSRVLKGLRQQLIDVYHQNKELEEAEKGITNEEEDRGEDWSENINFIVSGGGKK